MYLSTISAAKHFQMHTIQQGSPNYGPRSHFIRPAKAFCQ